MKIKNLSKLLILLLTVLTCNIQIVYSETEAESSTLLDVQQSVAISKEGNSKESAEIIDVVTGTHSGLQSVFKLQTNLTDEEYDFIITAKAQTVDGEISAYTNNGELIFTRITTETSAVSPYPSNSDVNNIKNGGNQNRNIIAYPVNILFTSENQMNSVFHTDYKNYGSCYSILINDNNEAIITHFVSTKPVPGSYNITQDEAGTYQTVVTLSAVSK